MRSAFPQIINPDYQPQIISLEADIVSLQAQIDALIADGGGGTDFLYGTGIDGSRTEGGASPAAITKPVSYTDLILNGTSTRLSMGGYPVQVFGDLIIFTGCTLHHDGAQGTDNGTAGGANAAAGSLASTTSVVGNGGGLNSAGGSPGTNSDSLGGRGGNGGASTTQPGGTAPVPVVPNTTSWGRFDFLDLNYRISSVFSFARGGSPGAGGGGSAAAVGAGGGGGAGLGMIKARNVILQTGAKITWKGGRGGNNSGLNAGAGGGAGGGFGVIFCDSFESVDPYATCIDVSGGIAGVASNGGFSGSPGLTGRTFVFVRGKLKHYILLDNPG